MAKFKAAGSRKPSARSNLAVVPCAVVILAATARRNVQVLTGRVPTIDLAKVAEA